MSDSPSPVRASAQEQGYDAIDELQLVVNSMGDVVTLERFAAAVDPIRLVVAWREALVTIQTVLAAEARGRQQAEQALNDYKAAECSCDDCEEHRNYNRAALTGAQA